MPRGLSTEQKEWAAQRVKGLAYFVALELLSGTIRIWNGLGDITVFDENWKGVGELGIIEGLEGDRSLKSQEITLGLVGVPGSSITGGMIAQTRSERYQGRPLTIYMGFTNPQTGAPLGDPFPIWDGVADVMTFSLGQSATISLTGQHFDSHARRANGFNMSTLSHNLRMGNSSPSDLFFEPQDRLMGVPRPLL